MIVLKVTKPELSNSGYILKPNEIKELPGEIDTMLYYGEIGDSLLLTVVEMPREEIDKLPEFTGW